MPIIDPPIAVPEGAVLVRVPASDRSWVRGLPAVPGGHVLTVTVSHPALLPVPVDALVAGGYRIAGVPERAGAEHTTGGSSDVGGRSTVDVLVPVEVQERYPAWWRDLLGRADRAFDLRLGPVVRVLAAELALHLRSPAS